VAWALLLVALVSCGRRETGPARAKTVAPTQPREVRTARVAPQPMPRSVMATGTLRAREDSTLSVKVAGRLQNIAVDLGSTVSKGQVLAQVEPQDYDLQLRQAEALLAQARARLGLPLDGTEDRVDPAQASTVKLAKARLDEARLNRERVTSLTGQGIVAQSEQETAEAAYQVAANVYRDAVEEVNNRLAQLAQRRVEVEIARKRLADSSLVAPFDGVVRERRASPGEYLPAGTAVLSVVATDPLRLRVEVPEREAARIEVGQRVQVTAEGDAQTHTGVVQRVSPAIDPQTRMLILEADVPHQGALRPGSFARAEIVIREREPTLAVPRSALVTFAGVEKVFTVEEGKARERAITTGRRRAEWVEIVQGLREGEAVVLDPGNLQTGQPVQVTESADLRPAASG
jgi:RND family efflux transporter MFP subunit